MAAIGAMFVAGVGIACGEGDDPAAKADRDGGSSATTAAAGGDDGDRPAEPNASASTPRLPPIWADPARFLLDIGKYQWEGECAAVRRVNSRSQYRFKCPVSDKEAFALRFRGTRAAESYGSGAVIEYKTGDVTAATALLYVSPGGKWAVARYGLDRHTNVNTSDARSREGYDEAVAGYLEGIKERVCPQMAFYKEPFSPRETPCPKAYGSSKRRLGDWLRLNPDSTPEYLGGNQTFGFYGLTLESPKPRYWTISVMRNPRRAWADYAVVDMMRGPLPRDR